LSEAESPPSGTEADEQAILDMLVSQTRTRVGEQLQNSDELGTRALGVAAVDVGALALVVAVRDDLSRLWWVPVLGYLIAGGLLLGTVWPRVFDAGPDPRRFYDRYGGGTRLDASRAMLSELLAAKDTNDPLLTSKNRVFKWGFGSLILAILVSLIAVWVD
jgi:hypothetical protein